MSRPFRILSWSDLYSGKWVVVRMADLRIVFESYSPHEASRWVETWGPVSFSKKGVPLSVRAAARLNLTTP
jgi:hypothetical protein